MEFLKKPLKVYKKFLPTDLPTNAKFVSKILKFIQVNFTNDRLYFSKILDTNFAFVGKSVGK